MSLPNIGTNENFPFALGNFGKFNPATWLYLDTTSLVGILALLLWSSLTARKLSLGISSVFLKPLSFIATSKPCWNLEALTPSIFQVTIALRKLSFFYQACGAEQYLNLRQGTHKRRKNAFGHYCTLELELPSILPSSFGIVLLSDLCSWPVQLKV